MKIVHTCNRYYPYFGGLETHVQHISEKMVQLGHDVSVYSADPSGVLPPSEILNGVKVRRFKCFAPQDSYFFSTYLYKSLKTADCDLIHGHDLNGFPLLAGALAKGARRYFASLHVGAFSSYFRNLARIPYDRLVMHRFLGRASKIICVSEYEKRLYQSILSLPQSQFIVIPNGYDLPLNVPKNVLKNGRSILSVGRLEKAKGFHYLLKSFAKVGCRPEFNDVTLTLVGKGPYETQLRRLISELGLNGTVKIKQNVPREELLNLYAQCDLFVLLSNYESQGLAVWDAFALRKPTITSTSAVLGEYAKQGYSLGVELPPNTDDLAAKIEKILRNPQQYTPRPFKMPSWTEVTKRIIALYNETLSQ
ncbi:MAG: glycosyltransferase family 4 protein [Candidatus Bathyarchaeota archaeon]|nr:glycosyltransferase family 4 protein [Candidatus Bathyarchaeota archaeon]